MSTRSERIKLLIEESGKSYQELERITGIKKSSLQRYATGTTVKIPLDVIERLSKTFNVSQEYLMGWTEGSEDMLENTPDQMLLTEGEKMLIDLFRQIPEDAQKMYLEVLRASLKSQS